MEELEPEMDPKVGKVGGGGVMPIPDFILRSRIFEMARNLQ